MINLAEMANDVEQYFALLTKIVNRYKDRKELSIARWVSDVMLKRALIFAKNEKWKSKTKIKKMAFC